MSSRNSTGVSVAQNVYTTLFLSSEYDNSSTDGPAMYGVFLWATAGVATVKVTPTDETGFELDSAVWTKTSPMYVGAPANSRGILKIAAAGSGAGATVGFRIATG